MMKQTVLVLALAACVSATVLPVHRIPHTGPHRRLGLKQGRIIGGSEAEIGQFPYQVSLQWLLRGVSAHFCGGALVKADAVVTAGQCAHVVTYGTTLAYTGLTSLKEGGRSISVIQERVHPEYEVVGDHAINDIAVFLLMSGFKLDEEVNLIALPGQDQTVWGNNAATLSGWGSTSNAMLPELSDTLNWVEVTVIPTINCYALMPDDSTFNNNNLCTGPVTGSVASCMGDVGSPLVQYDVLVGIVSWNSVPCGSFGMPIVYTSVPRYADFIKENLEY